MIQNCIMVEFPNVDMSLFIDNFIKHFLLVGEGGDFVFKF